MADSSFVSVDIDGRVIRMTADHSLFVHGKGWTAAGELRAGDRLRKPGDRWAVVRTVRREEDRGFRPFLGFAAGTPILTADGAVPIEDIRPGDLLDFPPDDPNDGLDDQPPSWLWN